MIVADTVFVNGKVATVDPHFTFQRAVAIKDGWIIDVGQDADIQPYIGEDTKVIDLEGKLLMPGAHDAHTHGVSWATTLMACNCGAPVVNSIADLKAALKKWADTTPPGEWIRGEGLNPDALLASDGRKLTHFDIDDVTPNNPVIIQDYSGHAAFANAKALELAGITKDTADPASGHIGRMENGEPDGMFYEAGGTYMIMTKVPKWTEAELRKAILTVQRVMNEGGYTSYTESTLGPANDERESGRAGRRGIYIYKQLQDEGKLTCRVAMGFYTGENGFQSAQLMEEQLENFEFPEFNDPNWLKMDMAKIFSDGVPAGHNAWMLTDYLDAPGNHGHSALCGPGATDEEQEAELHKMILVAHKHGYQVGIHAIGDRAVEAALNGIIKANQECPGKDLRHYIIHAEMFGNNAQAARAAHYHVGFSSQPGMGAYLPEEDIFALGERRKRSFGLKEMLAHGVMIAGGNDAICGPDYPNWLEAVEYCTTRKSVFTGKAVMPELAITVEQAVRLFTINAAYQEHREYVTGSIEVGKAADLQVLDQDIFTIEHEKIGKTKVLMTMVEGKIVFEREHA